MFKIILSAITALAFASTSYAATKEIQINGSSQAPFGAGGGGTNATININDSGSAGNSDSTNIAFGAEAYFSYTEVLQIGGIFSYADYEALPDSVIVLGGVFRYNLDTDLRNSIFIGGGLVYADSGADDNIALLASAGKRFPISQTITWTPNVSISFDITGDNKGHNINLNLLSFSGFLD